MYGPLSNPLAVLDLTHDRQSEGERLAANFAHGSSEPQPEPRRHRIREALGRVLAAASLGRRPRSTPWSAR